VAADNPVEVSRAHVESFQAWVIQTRSVSTALNKHKGLQQFFKWLRDDEQEIARSPMERVRQPKTPQKLIPIIRDEDTAKVLAPAQERVLLRCETRRSSGCCTTPEHGCLRSPVSNSAMLIWLRIRCATTTRAARISGCGSVLRPAGR
jgi:integrase